MSRMQCSAPLALALTSPSILARCTADPGPPKDAILVDGPGFAAHHFRGPRAARGASVPSCCAAPRETSPGGGAAVRRWTIPDRRRRISPSDGRVFGGADCANVACQSKHRRGGGQLGNLWILRSRGARRGPGDRTVYPPGTARLQDQPARQGICARFRLRRSGRQSARRRIGDGALHRHARARHCLERDACLPAGPHRNRELGRGSRRPFYREGARGISRESGTRRSDAAGSQLGYTFALHNRNDVEDPTPVELVERTKAEMAMIVDQIPDLSFQKVKPQDKTQ